MLHTSEDILVHHELSTNNKLKEVLEIGKSKVAFLIDFDRTITYAEDPSGHRASTSYMALSDAGCLDKAATDEILDLYKHYHPIELLDLPRQEKLEKMVDWWHKVHEIFIREKVTLQDVKVAASKVFIRQQFVQFISLAKELEIPVYIISAGSYNIIEESLVQQCGGLHGVTILSNRMIFNGDRPDSYVTSFSSPLIHILNKNILSLPDHIENKEWFIIIGDSLHDLDMAGEKDRSRVLSIGFANSDEPALTEALSRCYDIVLKKRSDFSFPYKILTSLKNKEDKEIDYTQQALMKFVEIKKGISLSDLENYVKGDPNINQSLVNSPFSVLTRIFEIYGNDFAFKFLVKFYPLCEELSDGIIYWEGDNETHWIYKLIEDNNMEALKFVYGKLKDVPFNDGVSCSQNVLEFAFNCRNEEALEYLFSIGCPVHIGCCDSSELYKKICIPMEEWEQTNEQDFPKEKQLAILLSKIRQYKHLSKESWKILLEEESKSE